VAEGPILFRLLSVLGELRLFKAMPFSPELGFWLKSLPSIFGFLAAHFLLSFRSPWVELDTINPPPGWREEPFGYSLEIALQSVVGMVTALLVILRLVVKPSPPALPQVLPAPFFFHQSVQRISFHVTDLASPSLHSDLHSVVTPDIRYVGCMIFPSALRTSASSPTPRRSPLTTAPVLTFCSLLVLF